MWPSFLGDGRVGPTKKGWAGLFVYLPPCILFLGLDSVYSSHPFFFLLLLPWRVRYYYLPMSTITSYLSIEPFFFLFPSLLFGLLASGFVMWDMPDLFNGLEFCSLVMS